MKKFTIEEFQSDFDNLMGKVENGESFILTSEYGEAVITPYDQDLVKIYTEMNNEAP